MALKTSQNLPETDVKNEETLANMYPDNVDRDPRRRENAKQEYSERLANLDQMGELKRENVTLKKQIKDLEERYLTSDEKERKRWQEFQSQIKKEKEELLNRSDEWEKKYRRMFLENSLISAVNNLAGHHGYRVKDLTALKGLLLAEEFSPVNCRLRRVPDSRNIMGSEFEVVIDIQSQDQTGQSAYQTYDLNQGLEKVLLICPWLFEAVPKGGAGMRPGVNISGNIGTQIDALKNKVKNDPADRASRIQLTRLLALKQKKYQGGF